MMRVSDSVLYSVTIPVKPVRKADGARFNGRSFAGDDDLKTLVGEFMKRARAQAGLSQTSLAEKVGISVASLNKAEQGVQPLSMMRFLDYIYVCDVSADDVLKFLVADGERRRGMR
ncbi:helix-turn-helix domain-containing protein [Acetobacter fallax]|uniref:Helix-turn-helix domain-containing protein n=1 Tax=Acetobacter fallax TaxID=1737473 RepID=A0ABX0KA49_9PROT|nr:helix-turn-helix transcriptional regulator [Acetobacter fallax]NHO33294.1 helix-turn-helix domain-containing protein [Acetobacter fallax]NHO36915.1 helix-turn-helix domain-containing protein [Acetobacter fallax]